MNIEAGQNLLHYRIVDKLGEGGMGVVWRAVDTNLDREVAIKLLPAALGDDGERLARFDREAKLLASLNHPSIAGIYGAHEADGVRFLAMELVEGEDLSQRLARGPIPVDEAIDLAGEIAGALATAHEAGVIHRDLKPANVMLTPGGQAKVLDFGLAKALSPDGASGSIDPGLSPTLTSAGTVVGTILGTAAYMSPEQAKGKEVDRRADVWSFGCVLYECLTGKPAFPGESVSEILAEVLKSEPKWDALPTSTPAGVRRMLRRCLAKKPADRLRDLGDARLELADTGTEDAAGDASAGSPARPTSMLARAGWFAAAALAIVTIVMFANWPATVEKDGPAAPPLHAEIGLPADAELGYDTGRLGVDRNMLALSPDGTLLVYVGKTADGGSQLYRKELTGFDPPAPIPGTEGASHAFFAPDGRTIGFITEDKLKRVMPNGDLLKVLASVTTVIRGQWSEDGTIWLGADQGRALQRVSPGGGEPETIYTNRNMVFQEVMPDGKSALIVVRKEINADFANVALLDLETKEYEVILPGGYDARTGPNNRLIFARGGDLLSMKYAAGEGRATGMPKTLLRDVVMDSLIGVAQYDFSESGTVVFARGPELSRGTVARVDRDGNHEFLPIENKTYGVLDLDPTDQKVAIHVVDVDSHVWVYDIPSGRGSRLPGNSTGWPVWSNDGERIAYNDMENKTYRIESFGGAASDRITIDNPTRGNVVSWSPDDRLLAVTRRPEGRPRQMGFYDFGGEAFEWIDSGGSNQTMPYFSPDGKWLAYSSNETGTWEIWVRSYPEGEVVRQISDGGGLECVWSPSGELFYRLGSRFMSVKIETEPELSWSAPRVAFHTDFIDTMGRSFDVSSDGQQLYVIKQPEPPDGRRLYLVQGWEP